MTTLSRSLLFVLLALPVPLAWADQLPAAVSAAASTAPPAPSTTEPSVILNSQTNSGDTAWMLASIALLLIMTAPGLALPYGGMVRSSWDRDKLHQRQQLWRANHITSEYYAA